MRDYLKFWIAYETYDPSVFPDTPQWDAEPTIEQAQVAADGMVPAFGGTIQIIPAWFRLKPKDEFVAMVNATRSAGLFANQFFPGKEGGNGFWYFDDDLRKMGFNSKDEKPKK